jgi:hypothetical protein
LALPARIGKPPSAEREQALATGISVLQRDVQKKVWRYAQPMAAYLQTCQCLPLTHVPVFHISAFQFSAFQLFPQYMSAALCLVSEKLL